MKRGGLTVALAGNNYAPEFCGGTERVMQALARALVEAGDEVLVICGSEQPHAGADVVREVVDGVEVCRIPRRPDEGYGLNVERPRVLGLVRELLVARGVDVLHVHHWSHLSDGLVRLARDLGLGAVVTLHDVWTTCPRFFRLPPEGVTCPDGAGRDACVGCANRELKETDEWVRERLARRDVDLGAELAAAHALVAPSRDCADAVLEHRSWRRDPPPIEVVPHGLLDDAAPAPRGPLGLPFRVGTFGNLHREKGVLLLVEAMAGIPAELHLHGDGPDDVRAEVLASAAARGVRVTWHGPYVAGGQHPAAQLDLAVFPSLCRETYGLVVDEALHQGTPVIVAHIGALPERVAGGGGFAVPPGDVEALAHGIRGVVEERDAYHLLRSMIPAGFPTVAAAAERYRHLYSKAWAATRVDA